MARNRNGSMLKSFSNNIRSKSKQISTPWLKNAMKGIGAAAKDTLKDIAPVLYDASSEAGKATKDAITLLRGNTNATAMNKLISKNIYVRTARDMIKWTMEDLRSGKLFNEDRVTDIIMGGDGSGSGLDDPDSMFSDWDMDDDGSSGNVIINNNSDSSNAGFALAVNEGLRESTMAQLKGQQAMVDTMVAISGSQILQNQEIGNQIITQLTNVNNNLIAINEFNKTTMTSFVTTVTAYMEKMGKKADEDSSTDEKFDPASIFSGGFNLGNYGKHIKKNMKSSFENSDIGFIHSLVGDPETLKMMTANPLGMLTTFTMKAMTPKLLKKTMSQIDEAVAGFMPSLLMRIGELSESKELGWKGKLKRWLGDVFGIQGLTNTDRNRLNPTKNITKDAAVFDGITRHTIVEIIPKYLSESVSYLKELVHVNGGNVGRAMGTREIFDFNKGRFSTVAKSRKDLYEQIRSSGTDVIASGKLGRHIDSNSGAAYTDKDGKYDQKALEQWNDMVTKFYDQLERMNKMIDMTNFSEDGDIMKAIKGTGYGGKMAEFLKQLMIEASKDTSITTSANSDFQRARYSRKATIKDMNENPDYYNLSAVGDLSEDIDKTMDRIFGGVFGNPNEIKQSGSVVKTLSDIRYILNRGINVRITGHGPYQTFTGQETNINNINRENTPQRNQTQPSSQNDEEKAGPTKLEEMSTEEMINHVAENGTLYNDDTKTTKKVKDIMHALLFGNASMAFSGVADIFVSKINSIIDVIDKDFFQPMKASLFGTKDEQGYSRNGVFSGMQQQFTDYYRSIVRQFNGKGYTDSKGQKHDDITDPSKSVVGQIKATVSDIKETVVDYVLGPKDSETGKREKGMGLVNIFREGIEGWGKAIFGETKDGKPNFDPEKFKKEISERMPAGVTGALGGAVLGSMTSGSLLGWLVGGPVTGSILGLATGFAAKSKRFQEFLFGEKDEEGNIVRDSGIINKQMQDWFKKNKVPIVGGAAVGAAKSILLGNGFLTGMVGNIIGGPLAGALLGSIGGIALRSETFKTFLFGNMDKPGGWHKGIIPMFKGIFKKNDGTTDEGKSMLGMAGIGAGVGYLSAALIGKMGFLGAMATPFGPIGGAIAGLALSIKASQGGFREWLFGKENEDGTKSAGILGRFANMLNAELLTPFKQGAMEFALDTRDFLIDKIMAPIEFAIEPFANAMKDLGNSIKKTFEKIGGFIVGAIKEHMIKPITETIGKYILSPIRKTFGILFKLTTGIIKSIVAAPFSAIGMMANYGEYKERKRSRRMAIDDVYEEQGLLGGLIHQGKVMFNYGDAREKANHKHHRYSDWNERKKRYEADRLERAEKRKTQREEGRRNVRNRILMARYSGGELLEDSEENRARLEEMLKNNPRKRKLFGLLADRPNFKGAATEENRSNKLDNNNIIKNADSPGSPVDERQLGTQLSILDLLRKIFGLNKDNKKLKGSRRFTGGRRTTTEDGENPEPQNEEEIINDDENRPAHKSLFQRLREYNYGNLNPFKRFFGDKKDKGDRPRIRYYAEGGDHKEDGMAVVGEEGPELVRLARGSRIFGGKKPLPVTVVDMNSKAVSKFKVATAPKLSEEAGVTVTRRSLIDKQREEDKADYQKQKEAGKLENIEKRKLEEEKLNMERENHDNIKATRETQENFSLGWNKIFSKKGVVTAGFLLLLPLLIKWLMGKGGDGGGGPFGGPDIGKQVLNDLSFGQDHLQDRKNTLEMVKETADDTKHLFKGDIWKWVTSDGGWDHESGAKLNFLGHIPVALGGLIRPFLKTGTKQNKAVMKFINGFKNSKFLGFGKRQLGRAGSAMGSGASRFGTRALEYMDEAGAGINLAVNMRAANPGSRMKDVLKDMKLIKQGEGSYREALETMKTFQNSGYGSMDEALGMMGYGGEGYKVLGKGSGATDDIIRNTTRSSSARIAKTGGLKETMLRQKELAKLAKNETAAGNKYLASLADDGDELAKLLGDTSGATNSEILRTFKGDKNFARQIGQKQLANAGEETAHSFWKKSVGLGDDLGEAGAKLGQTFGDDGLELAAKAGSFSDDAARAAGKAGKGFTDDALRVASKSIGNLMDEFWKVAAKVGGKIGSKMPSFVDDILRAIGKKFAYFTAKLAAIMGKTAALAATVVGYLADQTLWITVGAVDGLTGAARLFQIDRPDWIMVALSGAIGAFKGTTVGSILDLINEIVHSVLGLDMFHELASWVYGFLAGNTKYQNLLKQKEEFKNQFLEDDEASLRKQYNAYLGITGTNENQVSFEKFMGHVNKGDIKVKTESFADYNERKHASALGHLGRGTVNAINATGNFLVGTDSQSWTDQMGNTWVVKDDRKGIAQVYSKDGQMLGEMSAENIDKENWTDNGKKEGKGVIGNVVDFAKDVHRASRNNIAGRMALGTATMGMSEIFDKNNWDMVGNAVMHPIQTVKNIGQGISNAAGVVGSVANNAWDATTGFVSDISKSVGDFVSPIFKGINNALKNIFAPIIGEINLFRNDNIMRNTRIPEAYAKAGDLGGLWSSLSAGVEGGYNQNTDDGSIVRTIGGVINTIHGIYTRIGYSFPAAFNAVGKWFNDKIIKPQVEFATKVQPHYVSMLQGIDAAASQGDISGVWNAGSTAEGEQDTMMKLFIGSMSIMPKLGGTIHAGINKVKLYFDDTIMKPFREFAESAQPTIDERNQAMATAAAAGDPEGVGAVLGTPSGKGPLVDLYSNVMLTFPWFGYKFQAGVNRVKIWWDDTVAKPFREFNENAQPVIDERKTKMWEAAAKGDAEGVGAALGTPSGKGPLVDLYSNVMLTFPWMGANVKAGVVKIGKVFGELFAPEGEAIKSFGSNVLSYWKNLNSKFDGEGYQKISQSELFSFGNSSIINTIAGSINGVFGMVWYGIRAAVEDTSKFFKDAWDTVTQPFKWVWDNIKNAVKENETTKKSWNEIVNDTPTTTNSTPNNKNYNSKILTVDSSGKVVDKNAGGGNGGGKGGKDISLPYFSQNDPRWGNKKYGNEKMSDAGCGPNVMASVASGLGGARGGSVSPVEMADYAKEKGYRDNTGTNWNFVDGAIRDYGLSGTKQWNPNARFIHDEVKKGNPVVLSGYSQGPFDPYTREGHYVVATGVDNNGSVTINDPRGREYSGKFDINNVANSTAVGWGVRPGGKGGGYGPHGSLPAAFRNKGRNKKAGEPYKPSVSNIRGGVKRRTDFETYGSKMNKVIESNNRSLMFKNAKSKLDSRDRISDLQEKRENRYNSNRLTSNSTLWSNVSTGNMLSSNSTLWSTPTEKLETINNSGKSSSKSSSDDYGYGGDWGGDYSGGSYDSGGAVSDSSGGETTTIQEISVTEGGTWSSDIETYARQVLCSSMLHLQGKLRYSQGGDRSQVMDGFTKGHGVGDCSSTISILHKYICGLSIGDWSGAIRSSNVGLVVDSNTGGVPDESKLLPGDVICYNNHVEMYLGNDQSIGHGAGMGPKLKQMKSYTQSRNARGSGKKYICTKRFVHDGNVTQVNVPPGVTPDAKYAVPGTSVGGSNGKSGGSSSSGGGLFGNIMQQFSTFIGDIGNNAMEFFLTGKWGDKYTFGGGTADQNSSDSANSPSISEGGGAPDNFTGDFDYIGRYIKPFESGKEGSAKVSSGKGDRGGVSFGTFQFPTYNASSVPGDSKLRKFWEPYASKYPGVQPGANEAFKKAWKDAAVKEQPGFLKREIEINGTATIGSNLSKMRSAFGDTDVDRALQEVIYSSLNHYGNAKSTMDSFNQAGISNSSIYKQNPKEALKKIYQAKYDRIPINFKSSPQTWKGIRNRFSKEEPSIVIPLAGQKPLPEWGKPVPTGGGRGGSDDPFVELSRMSDGADITKQDFKVNTGGKYARKIGGGRGYERRYASVRRSMNSKGYFTKPVSGGGRGGSNDAMLELLAIMINRLTDIANSSASSDAKLTLLRDLHGNTNIISNNINAGGKKGDTTVIVKKDSTPQILPVQSRASKTAERIAKGW